MTNPGTSKVKLQITTPSDREIAMTRVFDAPRRLVFDAFTKPELVKQWLLGPPGWTMPVCEIDLRVGGQYRYVWRRESNGKEMGMGGVYKEISPPERLVSTESWGGHGPETLASRSRFRLPETRIPADEAGRVDLKHGRILKSRRLVPVRRLRPPLIALRQHVEGTGRHVKPRDGRVCCLTLGQSQAAEL